MQKTYKCKNGHKFKKDEGSAVLCPTCNESAEPVKWNNVDGLNSLKGPGIIEDLGAAASELPGGKKALKLFGYLGAVSLIKKL